jgi:hypothetical protein
MQDLNDFYWAYFSISLDILNAILLHENINESRIIN